VQDAHAHALSGKVTLIDIRRPDEWARTGVPEGGIALDMRRKDFAEVLLAEVKGAKDRPLALICARGVRSRAMTNRLVKAGFTRVLDVPEGMLGSGAGPGWVKAGLPVVAP
jgi:rhodanese-related sulfurtransferase